MYLSAALPAFGPLTPGKPTQLAHMYSLLHSILASAVREEPPIIDVNPARIRGGGKIRRARRIEPATPEEIDVTGSRGRAGVECARR